MMDRSRDGGSQKRPVLRWPVYGFSSIWVQLWKPAVNTLAIGFD